MPDINLHNYPILLKEWSNKNTANINALKKSNNYVWNCEKGHDYTLQLSYRTDRKLKCPYCAGQRILQGYNDVATTDPWIVHKFSKNSAITAHDVSRGSKKKALFVCEKNHEYEQTIKNAVILHRGCPYCSNHMKKVGYNDLTTIFPEIAQEYSTKNDIPVENIWAVAMESYKHPVEWICRNKPHHTWQSSLYHRISEKMIDACPYCRNIKMEIGFNDIETVYPILKKEWSNKNTTSLSDYTYQSCFRAIWECEKGHEWESYIFHRVNGNGQCPSCYTNSSIEREIYAFIEEHVNTPLIQQNRTILKRKEIDIYIPEKKIAIEVNGLYWHSEKMGKHKNYHYDKWKNCQEQGIQLITIWEDEWYFKKDIVKNLLLHKLSVSTSQKIPARKTIFCEIPAKTAKEFMNKHHIQGGVNGKYNYCLMHEKEIVAVMTLSKKAQNNKELNLLRFSTSETIQGGFTKILKNAIKLHPEIETITTFSDNNISNGSLYKNNGFIEDTLLKPDYSYVRGTKRYHKFNFRKSNFKNNDSLQYFDNMTETELANVNNLIRVWDCGKIKWLLKV